MRQRNQPQGVRKYYRAECSLNEQVGDLVYISADMVGTKLTVRTCDSTDRDKMPAWGMVVQKASDTNCVVQRYGIVKDLYTGLTPGEFYWVDSDGELGDYVRPGFAQIVGQAISTDTFFLWIEQGMVKLLAA